MTEHLIPAVDPETRDAYYTFTQNPIVANVQICDHVTLDLDENNQVVGIEVLSDD